MIDNYDDEAAADDDDGDDDEEEAEEKVDKEVDKEVDKYQLYLVVADCVPNRQRSVDLKGGPECYLRGGYVFPFFFKKKKGWFSTNWWKNRWFSRTKKKTRSPKWQKNGVISGKKFACSFAWEEKNFVSG